MNQPWKRYLHPLILVPVLFLVALYSLCCFLYLVGRPVDSFNSNTRRSNSGGYTISATKLEWRKKVDRLEIEWLSDVAENAEIALSQNITVTLFGYPRGVLHGQFPEHLCDQVTEFKMGLFNGNGLYLNKPSDLPTFPNLQKFQASGSDWNAAGYFEYLKECKELRSLAIHGNEVTIDPQKTLTDLLTTCPKLSSLVISGTSLDDDHLDAILSQPRWNKLFIETKKPLNHAQLDLLLNMKHLRSLRLPSIGNLPAFLAKGTYPEMVFVFFHHHDFRDLDVDLLRMFPNIQEIGISEESEISLEQLSHLRKSTKQISLYLNPEKIDTDKAKKLFAGSMVDVVE